MEEKKLSLPEIHAELIEQLRDVIAVCERHGIEYNLMCGTLLGAVRHKGFIPWDDDVDLLMTRANFEKFRVVYPKECDQRFELTYLDTWTPRVMNRDPEKAAAFTDFFILDPVPEAGLKRKLWFLRLHMLQGMMKKKVDYSRFSWKNKILLFGTHIMGLPFSTEWKAKMYDKWSTSVQGGNDLCMSNGAFELMMKKLTVKYAGKKIGYIAVHQCVHKFRPEYSGEDNYYHAALRCCEKWGVPYLDLTSSTPLNAFTREKLMGDAESEVITGEYTNRADGTHPNEAGYLAYYCDKIEEWLKTL
jgi:lipopolysaccharide cholinephosphotransferase